MSWAISMDLRERVAAAVQAREQTQAQIAVRFDVSVTTVERIARRLREGEGLRPRKIPGAAPKLRERHLEYLRSQIEADPYTNSYALAARFNKRFRATQVHRSTILRAMHDLGFSFKKSPYAPQRDRPDVVEERERFVATQGELDGDKLVFIDESGCHPGIGPLRGWSPRGQVLRGPEQSYARGQHVSMIGALRADVGICAQMTVNGGVKSKDFLRFVNEHLVPTLRTGDLVCWDNINMHKNKKVIAAIEAAGASVVFLPRYSPDMNPIEAAWAKVKTLIRRKVPATRRSLKCAIRSALRCVTESDALGWFEYCGFNLPCL